VIEWVRVQAPVRVLDAGGWTDTWFARTGKVCHIAAGPGAEVFARRSFPGEAAAQDGAATVQLRVPDFADEYAFSTDAAPGRHPLLEATLCRWAPKGAHLEVRLRSDVPPGSSLGTSATVVVALLAALRVLAGSDDGQADLARAAHEIETVDLCLQSGVQDQAAAAFGGANMVDIDPYPRFTVSQLGVPASTWDALGRRVVTVYLGARHDSSAMHETVIKRLAGDVGYAERLLAPLRAAAEQAASALVAGDIAAYGEAMITNTRGQTGLHPALVSEPAQDVIDLGRRHGAVGWKVNGAGGDGGTVTLIAPDDPGPLVAALDHLQGVTVLALQPCTEGARVVDQG
jgi:D-glycero-alpha-D-manno-heptose-7-phosphate kinase